MRWFRICSLIKNRLAIWCWVTRLNTEYKKKENETIRFLFWYLLAWALCWARRYERSSDRSFFAWADRRSWVGLLLIGLEFANDLVGLAGTDAHWLVRTEQEATFFHLKEGRTINPTLVVTLRFKAEMIGVDTPSFVAEVGNSDILDRIEGHGIDKVFEIHHESSGMNMLPFQGDSWPMASGVLLVPAGVAFYRCWENSLGFFLRSTFLESNNHIQHFLPGHWPMLHRVGGSLAALDPCALRIWMKSWRDLFISSSVDVAAIIVILFFLLLLQFIFKKNSWVYFIPSIAIIQK